MSKRSLFWGNGSGKLGEAVYYRAGGEQRTRAYVKNVKNPKSYQQALQRTKFNNLVGCFKGISTAVKSFYTNRASNQSPFNAFFRKNWPLNLWVTDKEITGVNEGVFQGLYVADGNLNLDTTITVESPTLADPDYYLTWTVPAGNYTIPVGTDSSQIVVTKEQSPARGVRCIDLGRTPPVAEGTNAPEDAHVAGWRKVVTAASGKCCKTRTVVF